MEDKFCSSPDIPEHPGLLATSCIMAAHQTFQQFKAGTVDERLALSDCNLLKEHLLLAGVLQQE